MAKSAKTSKLIVQPETAFSEQPSSANEKLIPEGAAADAAKLIPAAGLDAAGRSSEPAASLAGPDAPLPGAATGTISTNEPPQSDNQGGAGDTAGSAGSLTLEGLVNRPGMAGFAKPTLDELIAVGDPLEGLKVEKRLGTAEDEFRAKYPRMFVALDAWRAEHGDDDLPRGLRIRSKIDGFRRAGIPHSKAPVEHRMDAFSGPEQLEAIFAEPNLVVELI